MSSIGRNDPCPCKSGKKYKKCCLALEEEKSAADAGDLSPLRRVSDRLTEPLLKHMKRLYGPDAFEAAWGDFWDGEADPPKPEQMQWVLPWILFHWIPGEYAVREFGLRRLERPIAADYLEKEGRRLDPVSRGFLAEALKEPFSLWEVQRVEPGVGVEVKDLLIEGRQLFVREVSGSKDQRRWNLILAKKVTVEGESIFDGCLPYALQPQDAEGIKNLLEEDLHDMTDKDPPWALEDLRKAEEALLDDYLWFAEEKFKNFRMPQLRNTDNEEMILTAIHYDFDPPRKETIRKIIERLESVADPEEGKDEQGRKRLTFHWSKPDNRIHASWENTLLGKIHLYDDILLLETNSKERGVRLRSIIEEACGEGIRFRYDSYQEMNSEAMKAKLTRMSGQPEKKPQPKDEIPKEIREKILGEFLEKHYQTWPDQPLPALGGKTPRKAVKDEKGRRQVESLIKTMENVGDRGIGDMPYYDFGELRRELGIES